MRPLDERLAGAGATVIAHGRDVQRLHRTYEQGFTLRPDADLQRRLVSGRRQLGVGRCCPGQRA
jgi:hypothetical protein